MNKDGHKVWQDVLSGLRDNFSLSTYKTWFAGSYVVDSQIKDDKRILIVGLKNNFIKEQVEKRYFGKIEKVCVEKGYLDWELLFIVAQKEATSKKQDSPLFTGVAQEFLTKPLGRGNLKSGNTFGNFVVGQSNNLAYIAARSVCTTLGKIYNPLFLWGETGVGKTHLMHAIGNEVNSSVVDVKSIYVTAEKFTNDYLESLRAKTQPTFRQKYRSSNLLLFDDVQFLYGKESTQDEFFHTLDDLMLAGSQVVVASDRHPKELGKIKERIVSRFLGGMVADIGMPDVDLKMAIVESKLKEHGVRLDESIVSSVAQECASPREIEGVLTSILAQVKISGELDVENIKGALAIRKLRANVKTTPADLIGAVSDHFKIKREKLSGASRKASLVRARQIAMYLLRSELSLPLEEVGGFLGGRDHSTIIYGIEKMEKALISDASLKDTVLRIRNNLNKG